MFSDNCIGVIPDKSRVGLKYAYYSIGIIDYLYSGRIIGRVPNILIRTLAYFVVAWLVVVSVWSCGGRMMVRCWSRIVVCVLVK
jgi:hypothetical protein